jgi:PTS system glucitol/sorbitol-specific IIC component
MALSLSAATLAAATPEIEPLSPPWRYFANAADEFIGVFELAGQTFIGLVTGIVPLVIVLLTAVYAVIKWIGPEKIEGLGRAAARPGWQWYPVRYMILPFLAVFVLTNPMAYTMGRFLPESKKPAFYDSAVSYVHPITGLFPHANGGELFVYLGIAAGITTLGLPLGDLALRYLLVGLVIILIRGIVTEFITARLMARRGLTDKAPEEVAA